MHSQFTDTHLISKRGSLKNGLRGAFSPLQRFLWLVVEGLAVLLPQLSLAHPPTQRRLPVLRVALPTTHCGSHHFWQV